MRFLRPEVAWWLVAAVIALVTTRRRTSRRRFAGSTMLNRLASGVFRPSPFRTLPTGLIIFAFCLIGLALMDPVIPYADVKIESRGLDIVMLLDLSSSMQEPMEPVLPRRTDASLTAAAPGLATPGALRETRLMATKDAIKSFVTRRRDDRIGLIVFSDNAYVVSPLTFDHEYLLRYVDLVDDQTLRSEGMTAIGDGLALANYLLSRQANSAGRGNQVIVLFTDGESNKGRDPLSVLTESNAANIRVHFIGVDLEQEIRNKPQVRRLVESVRRFGGQAFNANTTRDLVLASQAIDRIEKGKLAGSTRIHDAPVFDWFALPALMCLAGAVALRAIPWFIDRT